MKTKTIINYNLDGYKADVKKIGIQATWEQIFSSGVWKSNELFAPENFGELYEIGLEELDKASKKEHGKYYTPQDVAHLMSEWLKPLCGENICDVCCGTGNLILAYLNTMSRQEARFLLLNGNLWLYDMDYTAMYICKKTIGILFGKDCEEKVHCTVGDFLDRNITLPPNAKVISNPPYYKIKSVPDTWEKTNVVTQSRELYSSIFEKILLQSVSSVLITPFSFISGKKFSSFRDVMNEHSGFIISFDNSPARIFNGRKHGIFNTNTANSVRAAITVTNNTDTGYLVSPLIRFKSEERAELLLSDTLKSFLPSNRQKAESENGFYKCSSEMEKLYEKWKENSGGKKLKDIVHDNGECALCVPSSCRYYTAATATMELQRTGKYHLNFSTEDDYYLAYAMVHSSFCYWFWRLYDGGINYAKSLLESMPLIQLSKEHKEQIIPIVKEMMRNEKKYLSCSRNANAVQETVKFPVSYRKELNRIFCEELGFENPDAFDAVHSNSFKN